MALYATLKLKRVKSALVCQTMGFTSVIGGNLSLCVIMWCILYIYPVNQKKKQLYESHILFENYQITV